jgi:hypothetical protein
MKKWNVEVMHLLCPKVKLQVPPLRYPGFPVQLSGVGERRAASRKAAYVALGGTGSAPVGMTKLRAVANLGSGGGGWTESKKLIGQDRLFSRAIPSRLRRALIQSRSFFRSLFSYL